MVKLVKKQEKESTEKKPIYRVYLTIWKNKQIQTQTQTPKPATMEIYVRINDGETITIKVIPAETIGLVMVKI
jgi:hypothetical protein